MQCCQLLKEIERNYYKPTVKRRMKSPLGPSLFESLWRLVVKKIINVNIYVDHIANKSGIEIGGPSFECGPPDNLGYNVYDDLPVSYMYSGANKGEFEPIVPSFCSDLRFEGLTLLNDS